MGGVLEEGENGGGGGRVKVWPMVLAKDEEDEEEAKEQGDKGGIMEIGSNFGIGRRH